MRISLLLTTVVAITSATTDTGCVTNTQDQRTIISIVTGVSGTGGAGGAGGASSDCGGAGGCPNGLEQCGCQLPLGISPECHRPRTVLDGTCSFEVVADGLPCRSGVGVCEGGKCPPPPATGCVPLGEPQTWPPCFSDDGCDDGNSCTIDSCPDLGCGPCLHVPVKDGTGCGGAAFFCDQGSCCAQSVAP